MTKKISFLIVSLLIAYLSYVLGYYNASNDALLFVKVLSANGHINTINYLKNDKYQEVYTYQKRNLEENVVAIVDIVNSKSKISKIPERYIAYKELFSMPLEEDVEKIKKKYERIHSESEY